MTWTSHEIEMIRKLIHHEDLEFVKQGLMLWESLVKDYHQHGAMLRKIATNREVLKCSSWQYFNLVRIRKSLEGLPLQTYIALWFLGKLADFETFSHKIETCRELLLFFKKTEKAFVFPDNISNLVYLEKLNISSRNRNISLKGLDFPRTLKKLMFKGIFKNIPMESIADVEDLEELECEVRRFITIPNSLAQLKKLKKIQVKWLLKWPSFSLQEWPLLEYLSVGGMGPVTVDNLHNLENLKYLSLKFVALGNSLQDVSGLKNLEVLCLKGVKLKEFPIEVTVLKNLKMLDLSDNEIHSIPDEIRELKNLETLKLSKNKISIISKELSELRLLRLFELDNNNLEEISEGFKDLCNLQVLNLNHNSLFRLPEWIGDLSRIEKLHLVENPFL